MSWARIERTFFIFIAVAAMVNIPSLAIAQQSPSVSEPSQTVQSVRVKYRRVPIKRGPSRKFKLRGMAVKNSRLPILAISQGPGCDGNPWYQVHTEGWVCSNMVELVDGPPVSVAQPPLENDSITPWPYAFLKESAIEYTWSKDGWLQELREIFTGFGFAVAKRVTIDGQRYFKSPEGKIIPTHAARVTSRISTFEGRHISGAQQWPVGWVNAREAWAYSSPAISKKLRVRKLERYDFFAVYEQKRVKKRTYYRIDEDLWLSGRDVRVASPASRPVGVQENERWIDVDVAQQIVTAYQGDTPVYVTMVSTGRGGASRTVKGAFRTWVKVAAIAMDNTDEEEEVEEVDTEAADTSTAESVERKLYSLQDVPWTQFFHESYALHAVYWHNRFGNRKSHGCVNLAPADAKWFYEWTFPQVPAGWWSVYATKEDKGTMVRVR